MTPSKTVELLNMFIVGQEDAKRACAVALRNRWRRHHVDPALKNEIVPKNILMIGPTGCGKTEIARRLAKITDSPFVKVEATKFTEVGFHGRDVDTIIKDLLEHSLVITRGKLRSRFAAEVQNVVESKMMDILCGETSETPTRESILAEYRNGSMDDRVIEAELPDGPGRGRKLDLDLPSLGGDNGSEVIIKQLGSMFPANLAGRLGKLSVSKKRLTVAECRAAIEEEEYDNVINSEVVIKEAISAAENDGIVFLDEIDKIVSSSESRYGADASSEGVQRDLLPIIEGSTVGGLLVISLGRVSRLHAWNP